MDLENMNDTIPYGHQNQCWNRAVKLENLQAAVALHFSHYNLVRLHKTLPITPAMAAGVTNKVWSLEELVERTSK